MRTFVLYGITKYSSAKLICVVQADDLPAAAEKLAGRATDIGRGGQGWRQLYFESDALCAKFTAGICTPEVLAKATEETGLDAEDMVAHNRYRLTNIFNELLIGEAPVLR